MIHPNDEGKFKVKKTRNFFFVETIYWTGTITSSSKKNREVDSPIQLGHTAAELLQMLY